MELTKEEIELIEKRRANEARKEKEKKYATISNEEKDFLCKILKFKERNLDIDKFYNWIDELDISDKKDVKAYIENKKGKTLKEVADELGVKDVYAVKGRINRTERVWFNDDAIIRRFTTEFEFPLTIVTTYTMPKEFADRLHKIGITDLSQLEKIKASDLRKHFNEEELKKIKDICYDCRIDNEEIEHLYITIEDLDLTVRSYNCLRRAHITTLGEMERMTLEQLSKIRNCGKASQKEIIDKLAEYNIKLK